MACPGVQGSGKQGSARASRCDFLRRPNVTTEESSRSLLCPLTPHGWMQPCAAAAAAATATAARATGAAAATAAEAAAAAPEAAAGVECRAEPGEAQPRSEQPSIRQQGGASLAQWPGRLSLDAKFGPGHPVVLEGLLIVVYALPARDDAGSASMLYEIPSSPLLPARYARSLALHSRQPRP